MKQVKGYRFLLNLLIGCAIAGMIGACDSGKEVVDEVTGNRAVKQYHKTKKEADRIAEQQAQRYKQIEDEQKSGEQEK
jgi:hypothetical protein